MNLCACGCQQPVHTNRVGRRRRYLDGTHRVRGHRMRHARDVTKRPTHVARSPLLLEVCNTYRRVRGLPVVYSGPYPGFRLADLLSVDGDRCRIRYRDPTATHPVEEVVPRRIVTGIVVDGRVDQDPERIQRLFEEGSG